MKLSLALSAVLALLLTTFAWCGENAPAAGKTVTTPPKDFTGVVKVTKDADGKAASVVLVMDKIEMQVVNGAANAYLVALDGKKVTVNATLQANTKAKEFKLTLTEGAKILVVKEPAKTD